jgi:hypothetical protein
MKELLSILSGLFEGLNIRRRWVAVLFLVFLFLSALLAYDYRTGYSYYASLEKKVNLLKELQSLEKEGISSNPRLKQVYEETIEEVTRRKISPVAMSLFPFSDSETFWKGVSGASLGTVILVLALLGGVPNEQRQSVILGAGSIAVLFGLIGAVVPTIWSPWVNYIGMPLIEILVLIAIPKRPRKT